MMRQVTNLVLLSSIFLAFIFIGLAILSGTTESSPTLAKFFVSVIAISTLAFFVYRRIEKSIGNKETFLSRPVAIKTGLIVINSAILLWLCAVVLLVYVMAKASMSIEFSLIALVIIAVALLAGWIFRKKFSSKSLLAYGLSFFGALLIVLMIFVEFAKYSKY